MIAELSFFMILDSYIFFRSDVIIIIIMKKLFSRIIKTLTMVSNNEEKYFSRVCIKARLVELSLLAAIYQFFYSQIKRLQDVESNNQYNNLYHEDDAETNHHEEMQGRVLISFHVDIENEILCHETRMLAFIFSFSWNFR